MIVGQDRAVAEFRAAWDTRALHHAWLLSGPNGVGKATFARSAATRILADAAGPTVDLPGLQTPDDHPVGRLVAAGSHLDFRWLERENNPKTDKLNRNISIDQIRSLEMLFATTPALSDWRVAVIDAVDDLERPAANALLKILEEPPAKCLFLLVTHAPGRLLPTIRSRCRRLDFGRLDTGAMTQILGREAPPMTGAEQARLIAAANGSAGRALAIATLDLAKLQEVAEAILRDGDPTNSRRSGLALELGRKGAAERYAAFLQLAPSLVAREAVASHGAHRDRALDAYAKARELAALAPAISLDPAATAFQMGSILAGVRGPGLP